METLGNMLTIPFGQDALWHDIATLDNSQLQKKTVNCKFGLEFFQADLTRYRYSTKEEMYRLGAGVDGESLPLVLYNGCLFCVRSYWDETHKPVPSMYVLTITRNRVESVHLLHRNEIDTIYVGCFEVQYRQDWYRCGLIGGISEREVSVVVDDPYNKSGLGSPNNTYLWGDGVEIKHNQIENVRLLISDNVAAKVGT